PRCWTGSLTAGRTTRGRIATTTPRSGSAGWRSPPWRGGSSRWRQSTDLSGGHRPWSSEEGTVWTICTGEIYNFPALRHRLEARGHTLRSKGDTEVLVHLYEDEGTGMFELLRGMFARSMWDAPGRMLILARDRLGQKPLLYRNDGSRLSFASELKAVMPLPEQDTPRRVDPLAVDEYLTYGYVPHPRTILEGVKKLPPAHYAVWHDGVLRIERYWTPDWNRA